MSKYKVLKSLPIEFLNTLNHNGLSSKKDIHDGIKFSYYPQKVKTYTKNCKCIACGIEANEVRIEYMLHCSHRVFGSPHLNVYANIGDYSVLITVDHNKLASQGGADVESNFNTMCSKCNSKRGSKYESLESFLKAIAGRDLLNEYMHKPKHEKDPQKEAEKLLQQKFWETGHHWHYREYLRYMKKKSKEAA